VVGRLDEVKAVKKVVVRYLFDEHPDLAAGDDRGAAVVEAPKGA
jgi:hypothetical protein